MQVSEGTVATMGQLLSLPMLLLGVAHHTCISRLGSKGAPPPSLLLLLLLLLASTLLPTSCFHSMAIQ